MDDRQLTPAEAALLLAPVAGTAAKCVQAGLLHLLSTGRIEVVRASGLLEQSAFLLTAPATTVADPLPGHLAVLEDALRSYGKEHLDGSQAIHALQKRFGHAYAGYVHGELAPSLIEQDLIERIDSKWLGLLARIRYRRTSYGDAVAAPLQRLMIALEQVPYLIKTKPEQALRLARSAGALLVMSPEARRRIPELRALAVRYGGGGAALHELPTDAEREDEWEYLSDVSDMALAFDSVAMFDGLDAIGDLTGGSSDGDGGGGDGGGGD